MKTYIVHWEADMRFLTNYKREVMINIDNIKNISIVRFIYDERGIAYRRSTIVGDIEQGGKKVNIREFQHYYTIEVDGVELAREAYIQNITKSCEKLLNALYGNDSYELLILKKNGEIEYSNYLDDGYRKYLDSVRDF